MTLTPEQLREMAAQVERGHQILGDDEILAIIRAHAAALEELAKLRARLEIDPRHSYDGIAARDETIRLLEAALAESERKRGRLKLTLHEIKEEWAGAECGEPATAQEGYAIELCKRMYRIATEFKEES